MIFYTTPAYSFHTFVANMTIFGYMLTVFFSFTEMEAEDEYEGLYEVMEENSLFQNEFRRYGNVGDFLNSPHGKIYARSVCVDNAASPVFLNYTTDVDGCVVELNSLNAIQFPVRHVTMLSLGHLSLRSIKPMLRKHVDLTGYTKEQLTNFNHCLGSQLFYQEGWEGWIGFVPCMNNKSRTELQSQVIKEHCRRHLESVKSCFRRKLMDMGKSGKGLRTLMKNDVMQTSKLAVVPDDSKLILATLQSAIDEYRALDEMDVILFCFRFGEKASGGVSLIGFDRNEIKRITIHSAINIQSEYMELLWSSCGLQSIVGSRGVLRSCLSFVDCANYQSNLDGRMIDISRLLRSVFYHPNSLQFVQLYADLPHAKPCTRYHPVSGSIVGGLIYPKQTSLAYKRDAERYISSLECNFNFMHNSSCRLEGVTELVEWKETVTAEDSLNVDKVFVMLEQQPLLVPFPIGMTRCVKEMGLWICGELKSLLENFSCTGNINATWRAFQLELAAEKVLWGSPVCLKSLNYSVNLGPGKLEPTRSLCDHLGFLALERWTACMAFEDSVPWHGIWTASELIGKKILKSVGMHDVIHSSTFVLGRRLVHALIADLYDVGGAGTYIRFEEFKAQLFLEKPTKVQVLGSVTLNQLLSTLCIQRKTAPVMVYSSLCQLLKNADLNIADILRDGFAEMGIKHFPAIHTYDVHRNPSLGWRACAGVWKIIRTDDKTSDVGHSANVLSSLVRAELEMRQLVHISKLKRAPITLPWIEVCARKLSKEKLSDKDLVTVLSFISCIGLMMNGWYVDYECLEALEKELPINQFRLRNFEVLSKLLMSHFHKFKLFRLHWTIPFKMTTVEATQTVKAIKTTSPFVTEDLVTHVEENGRITDEDNLSIVDNVTFRVPTCLPVGLRTKERWTADELELLDEVRRARYREQITLTSAYDLYKKKCLERNVQIRSFVAFKRKVDRMGCKPVTC